VEVANLDLSTCIHKPAPAHPSVPHVNVLTPAIAIATRRHLWSANVGDRATSRTKTVGFSPRSFFAAGPWGLNSLPSELENTSLTIGQFSIEDVPMQLFAIMQQHSCEYFSALDTYITAGVEVNMQ